jgi:hypothetical protein
MSDQTILREYLVSLGFKIDGGAQKKFKTGLIDLDKTAVTLGKTLVGAAVAAQAMVGVWAVQMEKLYYSSKRIGTTVGNLQALKYGAAQIGISGEVMQGALEGIARSIRSNPGLAGLIQSFGIKVEGRDMGDVAIDMVKALNKMPPYIAERFGALFGLDADTLFMLRQGVGEMEKAAGIRKKAAADLGIDTEAAALAGKEYANSWREILMYVGLLKDALAITLLPGMKELATLAKDILVSITGWVQKGMPGAATNIQSKEGQAYKASGKADPYSFSSLMRGQFGVGAQAPALPAPQGSAQPPVAAPQTAVPTSGGSSALFAALERKYGLPAGLLDKVWLRESGRGKNMLSSAGAKGHMGFMDKTAKAYGVTDPNDLEQSAEGSAHMWSDLLKQYKGDMRQAAAGYNLGSGRMQKLGAGNYPKETRDYQDYMAGVTQTNNITVTGSGDAKATAEQVKSAMRQANQDLVRQLKPRNY